MPMETNELTWLAGLLEGEGSFLSGPPSKPNRPCISLSMADLDIVQRAAGLVGVRAIQTRRFPAEESREPIYVIYLYGSRAVTLMLTLRPLMSRRRSTQIGAAVASYIPKRAKNDICTRTYEKCDDP